MHTIDNLEQQLAELRRQHSGVLAQSEDLAKQIKAAVRRESDLKEQLAASQKELNKLGFMQLGKKMIVKAEQDSIRKKLTANQQLQESLINRQQVSRKEQAALDASISKCQSALDALAAAPAPQAQSASPAIHAAAADDAPARAELSPAPVQPAEVKAAAKPAPRAKFASQAKSASQEKSPAVRKHREPRTAELSQEEQLAQLFDRLEALYPEHQVFAMDSICADLRDKLTAAAVRSGCADLAELLQRSGYTMIASAQGRALRQGRYCTPGQEPEVIRPLLASVLRRLEKHYPDRVITRSIQHDHKSLAQDVSGLYQWLGYDNTSAMLTAYGFSYQVTSGGRPATDARALLDQLRAAYAQAEKPHTISQIMADHPELARSVKTLQNQSPTRFGMPLRQYLTQEGILARKA